LDGRGYSAAFGFGDYKVDVLGHQHEAEYKKQKTFAGLLQGVEESLAQLLVKEIGEPVIAGEGDEMSLPGIMKTLEAARHGKQCSCID
jgi:hypothetical protein